MMPSKSDRIAICGELIPSSLKQRLLFFDCIGIFELDWMIGKFHDSEVLPAHDLEFLRTKDILINLKQPEMVEVPRSRLTPDDELSSLIVDAALKPLEAGKKRKRWTDAHSDLAEALILAFARSAAIQMQQDGLLASAVRSKEILLPCEIRACMELQTSNTIDVVLDKFPMPSELTPWEAILDFKADTEAQGYLQGLKVWMSDVARQKLTATEASEKLEWLLFEHKKHLEMHKLAYRWGTFGGTFVAAAEILEDLVKIKWSKAAGAVVSIFDKRLELMKSELDNPAKEISYIVKAQEQFGE